MNKKAIIISVAVVFIVLLYFWAQLNWKPRWYIQDEKFISDMKAQGFACVTEEAYKKHNYFIEKAEDCIHQYLTDSVNVYQTSLFEALNFCDSALKYDSMHPEGYRTKAGIYYRLNQTDSFINILEKEKAIAPVYIDQICRIEGIYYMGYDNRQKANEYFQKAVDRYDYLISKNKKNKRKEIEHYYLLLFQRAQMLEYIDLPSGKKEFENLRQRYPNDSIVSLFYHVLNSNRPIDNKSDMKKYLDAYFATTKKFN